MRLNVFDQHNKKYLSLTPHTLYHAPVTNELLCFEAYSTDLKQHGHDQLVMADFKIITHKGFVVAVRSSTREPRGFYASPAALFKALFVQFEGHVVAPEQLASHPLIHVIPDEFPGAGSLYVYDKTKLRRNGEEWGKLTLVEQEAKERAAGLRALLRLGYTEA